MLGPLQFKLGLFRTEAERNYSEAVMELALEFLTLANCLWLKGPGRGAPSLYASGARYVREERRTEEWQGYPEILETRQADCEDLSCALTALIRVRPAEARLRNAVGAKSIVRKKRLGTFTLYHIITQITHPDGTTSIEDPSEKLGMRD